VKMVEEFTSVFAEFKASNEEAMVAINASVEKTSVENAAKITTALSSIAKHTAMLEEIEQKVAAGIQDGVQMPPKSVGQMVLASAEYKALGLKPGETPQQGTKLRVEANTIIGQDGGGASDETLVAKDRRAGIVAGAFRALRVTDLLNVVPTTSNAYQYVKEDTFVNNAAETVEGAAKPQSSITFVEATANIRTIAHWIKASNQILADSPALRAYIDNRMTYGVDIREENQLVSGNGTGQNISGMTASGNFVAFTPTATEHALDSSNRAKQAVLTSEYAATGILMNPADWGEIERLKDTNDAYLVGNPFGTITPILWGLPVVLSNAMTAGKFLMSDFITSYDHVRRQGTIIDVGFENDDFTKNLITIRAEKRAALATIRAASTRYGDLNGA
ncbi:MAG: phage major capsid protein, partial [Sneathiella sp.]